MRQVVTLGPAKFKAEYIVHGNPSHVPILFFHGLGASASCIKETNALLDKKRLYVMAVNRPGTGNSEFFKPSGVFQYTEYLLQSLENLGINRVHVIGWSAGGVYAQAFCTANPEFSISLSLLSSAVPFYNPGSRKELPVAWKLISEISQLMPSLAKGVCAAAARQLRKHPHSTIRKFLTGLPEDDRRILADPGHYQTFCNSLLESFSQQGKGPYFDMQALFKQHPIPLETITVPTHIWHGSADSSWPVSFAAYLHSAIPHSTLNILPGKGHLMYLTEWESILESLPG